MIRSKRGVKAVVVGLFAMATMPAIFESGPAHAWPSPPSVSIPSVPSPPAPPPPPLPPFSIDGRVFSKRGGTSIEQIPASPTDCQFNDDVLVIRGPNVGLATSVTVGGSAITTQRRAVNSGCLPHNCLELSVETAQQTARGPRTVTLKAVDGRTITTTFDVAAPTGRCDNRPAARTYTSGGTSSTQTTRTTSGTSSSSPASSQQQPAQQPITSMSSRSKTCQGSTLVMSSGQRFTTRATQNVKVNVSFQAWSPCWCPSSNTGTCPEPGAGTRTWAIRRVSDGYSITVPWQKGESTVSVPVGEWEIDLREGSVPPGTFSVTYTP